FLAAQRLVEGNDAGAVPGLTGNLTSRLQPVSALGQKRRIASPDKTPDGFRQRRPGVPDKTGGHTRNRSARGGRGFGTGDRSSSDVPRAPPRLSSNQAGEPCSGGEVPLAQCN